MIVICNRTKRVARNLTRSVFIGRTVPKIDQDLGEKIASNSVKPKALLTRRNNGLLHLPAILEAAAQKKIASVASKRFRADALELTSTMYNLGLPDDQHTLKIKRADIKTTLSLRGKVPEDAHKGHNSCFLSEQQSKGSFELQELIKGTIEDRMRTWRYYEYNEYASHLYMAVRLPPNYSCLKAIMNEIRDFNPDFKPETVLDFGSGMGTTIWTVNETWPNTVREFLNIEISGEQQHLCEYLLRGASEFGETIPNVFHRQYLPTSTKVKYDMVVAAFSMLELPNFEMRAQVIESLWEKTKDFLVIVERGNEGGFAAINEARHFVLDLAGHSVTDHLRLSEEVAPKVKGFIPQGHVFSPCPHEFACPRASLSSKQKRNICRFRTVFEPLGLGANKPGFIREEYSYVVLRKKPHANYFTQGSCPRFPRIVEKRIKGGGQITHRLCCPNGHIAETVITKRYGKPTFELAKACDWGDILPIKAVDSYVSKSYKSPREIKEINRQKYYADTQKAHVDSE